MNKTFIWWKILCTIAVINIVIWLWALLAHLDVAYISTTQLLLSGFYVLVCAFRSFYPRIDLERYCLFDTPLSSIMLGRSLATLAELAFTIQCAIIIYDLGTYLESQLIVFASYALVPLIVVAQVFCWNAALTLNHFWHGMEEVMWVIMIAVAGACCSYGYLNLDGWLKNLMAIGIVASAGAIYIMLFVDIPMYFSRNRNHESRGKHYLSIDEGFRDVVKRRIPTSDWAVWKDEVIWISSYFTVGVWLSISMAFISFS